MVVMRASFITIRPSKRGWRTPGDVRQPRIVITGDRPVTVRQPGTSRLQHDRAKNAPASESASLCSYLRQRHGPPDKIRIQRAKSGPAQPAPGPRADRIASRDAMGLPHRSRSLLLVFLEIFNDSRDKQLSLFVAVGGAPAIARFRPAIHDRTPIGFASEFH